MFQDYRDLLSAFHAHGVEYLVVGGYAVILHAQPRFTRDTHFFIKADPANAEAVFAALAAFGAPLQGIRPEDFADRGSFFRFGNDPRGSISCLRLWRSISTRHGSGVSKRSSICKAASKPTSSPPMTALRRNSQPVDRSISRMPTPSKRPNDYERQKPDPRQSQRIAVLDNEL
jgi:hypothetical protein